MIKSLRRLAAAVVIAGAALMATVSPAQAAWYGSYRVSSGSATCVTMYDHIDQYGRGYGKSMTVCDGLFPTNVDWDIAYWPYGYKMYITTAGVTNIDSDSPHKFHTYSQVSMRTAKK